MLITRIFCVGLGVSHVHVFVTGAIESHPVWRTIYIIKNKNNCKNESNHFQPLIMMILRIIIKIIIIIIIIKIITIIIIIKIEEILVVVVVVVVVDL